MREISICHMKPNSNWKEMMIEKMNDRK